MTIIETKEIIISVNHHVQSCSQCHGNAAPFGCRRSISFIPHKSDTERRECRRIAPGRIVGRNASAKIHVCSNESSSARPRAAPAPPIGAHLSFEAHGVSLQHAPPVLATTKYTASRSLFLVARLLPASRQRAPAGRHALPPSSPHGRSALRPLPARAVQPEAARRGVVAIARPHPCHPSSPCVPPCEKRRARVTVTASGNTVCTISTKPGPRTAHPMLSIISGQGLPMK